MTVVGGDAKGLVARAQREAQRRGQGPSSAYLLLAMLQGRGAGAAILSKLGLCESDLLAAIREVDSETGSTLERALERAYRLAKSVDAAEVGEPHLLFATARDGRSAAHRCLEKVGIEPASLQRAIAQAHGWNERSLARSLPSESRTSDKPSTTATHRKPAPSAAPKAPVKTELPPAVESAPAARSEDKPSAPPRNRRIKSTTAIESNHGLDPQRFPLLSSIGRNLTAEAHRGGIDPVIGRDAEIERLLDVLARRRSNNPVLVGPPGVGKTAIAEGLAQRLACNPDRVGKLAGTILIEVSAGALICGTGVRGALSDRIRQLRSEVSDSERIVLFIDELHAIFTGGQGPDDLSHELKSSLARGELPCVGATTAEEYRRHVERDPALARRFCPVLVEEPSADDARAIVRALAPRYGIHHGVKYAADGLDAAVELSIRYLPERALPDKAIGLIDLAAARVRRKGGAVVDREAVAALVAEQVQVPVDRLLCNDAERLLQLETHLAEAVVGHEAVMARISDALRKGAAGFHGTRPLGTFLFLGPTGVGKTETARAINDIFFPGCAFTRFDMSEFSEGHTVARLLGAPPGYVGHDAGGQLTEAIRHRPYQLLLLDEVEKAHIDVLQSLLPLLDEGRVTDGKGRTVDCTKTIIVMTSNLGVQGGTHKGSIGFGNDAELRAQQGAAVLDAARRALPPELWNRIDEPLYFGPLSRAEVSEVARRMLRGVAVQTRDTHGIQLQIDEAAVTTLVEAGGYDATLGARPMRRAIGRMVEAPLASALLSGRFKSGASVLVGGEGGEIVFSEITSAEAAE